MNIDLCICGTDTNDQFEAGHWNAPTGSTLVATSCSSDCADAIEALRVDGRLTSRAVAKARRA